MTSPDTTAMRSFRSVSMRFTRAVVVISWKRSRSGARRRPRWPPCGRHQCRTRSSRSGVSEGSLLGEGVVEAVHSTSEGGLGISAVLGELLVGGTELGIHLLTGDLELLLHEGESG